MTRAMAMRAASALAVAASAISPAAAQTSDMDRAVARQQIITGQKEAQLREMEAAQARGDCGAYSRLREGLLTGGVGPLVQQPSFNPNPGSSVRDVDIGIERSRFESDVGRAAADDLRRRFEQIDARGCPPQGVSPAQPPALTTAPQPPVQPQPLEPDVMNELGEGRDLLRETGDAELAPAPAPAPAPRPPEPPLTYRRPPPLVPDSAIETTLERIIARARNAAARCDEPGLSADIETLERLEAQVSQTTPSTRRDTLLVLIRNRLAEARALTLTNCPPSPPPVSERSGEFDPYNYLEFLLGGYIGEWRIPTTDVGFVKEQNNQNSPAQPASRSSRFVRLTGVEGFVTFGNFSFGAGYATGDASRRFEVPAGVDTGTVFGAVSPQGFAGCITNEGISGRTTVDVENFFVQGSATLAHVRGFGGPPAANGPTFTFSGLVEYGDLDRDYSSSLSSGDTGPFQFTQERQQRLDDSYLGFELSAEMFHQANERLRLRLRASGGPYYIKSKLDSFERNTSRFGSIQDPEHIVQISESDSGVGVHGSGGASLEYRLGPGVSAIIGGSVDYRSRVGAVFNPTDGDRIANDGLTTGLKTDDAWSWRLNVGVKLGLGN